MDHQDFSKIANQLGSEWFIFGAHLGYSDAQLENLKEIYQSRPNDRNYMMLYRWHEQVEKEGEDAKILLAAHLEESGCKHLADELLQDVSSGKVYRSIHGYSFYKKLDEIQSINRRRRQRINQNADAIHMYLNISEERRKKVEIGIRKVNFDLKDNQQSVFVGQQIKRIINCPKCKRLFHKPRNLPCGHTFCHPCIVELLHKSEKTCPTCKECVSLRKEEDVEKLTINTLISDLITMNKRYEFWPIHNKFSNPCDMCSKPESLNFCNDCLKYMCSTCSASHSQWPALKTHFILEVNRENEPIIEFRKKRPQCKIHREEVVTFCVNCDHGVCEECKNSCPEDHVFDDLHSHCKYVRKEISQIIKCSSDIIEYYNECIEEYEKKEQELNQEKKTALEEVDTIMNTVHRLFELKAETMRSGIHEKHNRKNQQLHSEKEIILEDKTTLLSRIEYLQFLHEYGSDAHMVTEYEENRSSLVEIGVQPNLDALETFVIEFRKNPSLEEIVKGLPFGVLDDYYVENEAEKREEISGNKQVENAEYAFPSKQPIHSRPFERERDHCDELPPRPPPPLNRKQSWSLSMKIPPRVPIGVNQFVANDPFHSRPFEGESNHCDDLPPIPPRPLNRKQSWSFSMKLPPRVPIGGNRIKPCSIDSSDMRKNQHDTLSSTQDSNIENNKKEKVDRQFDSLSNDYDFLYSANDNSPLHSPSTEDEEEIYGTYPMYPSSDLETKIQTNEINQEKYPRPPTAQRNDFPAIGLLVQNITGLPRRARILQDFDIIVTGMAVSEKDIALISLTSRCINIFHYEKETFSAVSHECKKIGAPFDGVYTKDHDNVIGLFFTETDSEKRGVKILYKGKSNLKLVNFTSRVEDPRGISANDQNVFVCDRNRCSILVFKKDGELILSISNMYSRFQMPVYVFTDGHDRLVISDPSTYSVRVLSGIEDRCMVMDTFTSSSLMFEGQLVPGKCCVDHGSVLIPDRNNREVWNCSSKQKMNFSFQRGWGNDPIAVSRLNSANIVVATRNGKILVFRES